MPPAPVLQKIADYGGVTIKWLLEGKEGPELREHAPNTYAARTQPLNEDALAEIILRVRNFANRRRLILDVRTEAALIAILYGLYEADKVLPDDQVIEGNLPLARRR